MTMHVWLNGTFVTREDARLSAFDAGIQHGVGLFETMHARNGRIFRVAAHMQRLVGSAEELRLTERLRPEPLAEAAQQALDRNELDAARVRLTVTGGDLNLLQSEGRSTADPTLLIVAQPPTPYPPEFFTKGVVVAIADGRLNPFTATAGHKTLDYWARIKALQDAAARGAGEAMWFTVSNHLAGGSVSNVFLLKDDTLFTPLARGEEEQGAIPSAVLPGITRAAIIELAESRGLTVESRLLDIDELLGADEVFLTNSSWGVLPVVGIERETIGEGTVGRVTEALREGWLGLVGGYEGT